MFFRIRDWGKAEVPQILVSAHGGRMGRQHTARGNSQTDFPKLVGCQCIYMYVCMYVCMLACVRTYTNIYANVYI